jgi:hypothetical protein
MQGFLSLFIFRTPGAGAVIRDEGEIKDRGIPSIWNNTLRGRLQKAHAETFGLQFHHGLARGASGCLPV